MKASDVIFQIVPELHRGVYLIARASTPAQKEHAEATIKDLREFCKQNGIEVLGTLVVVEKGYRLPENREFRKLVGKARRAGVPILADSTDRYLRPANFHPNTNSTAQPTEEDFERLLAASRGVQLLTKHHPDEDMRTIRKHQSARGTEGKPVGRPVVKTSGWRKRRTKRLRPRAKDLREEGHSINEIARKLGISTETASRWSS